MHGEMLSLVVEGARTQDSKKETERDRECRRAKTKRTE
jgi:hypothetical protein